MPYNFAADSFHIKQLCSRLSSSEVRFFLLKSVVLRFSDPLLGRGTYDNHLRKRVVDFLIALINFFQLMLRLRSYGRISVENRRFCSNGGWLTQNFT